MCFALQAFQEHYYNTFDTNRQALSGLYKDDAFLSFEGQLVQGSQAITQKLTSLPFQQVWHPALLRGLHNLPPWAFANGMKMLL